MSFRTSRLRSDRRARLAATAPRQLHSCIRWQQTAQSAATTRRGNWGRDRIAAQPIEGVQVGPPSNVPELARQVDYGDQRHALVIGTCAAKQRHDNDRVRHRDEHPKVRGAVADQCARGCVCGSNRGLVGLLVQELEPKTGRTYIKFWSLRLED